MTASNFDNVDTENKKLFLNTASLGGLYMGGILSAGIILAYFLGSSSAWITNISILLAFVGIAYYMGKKYVSQYNKSVTFGRALGLIVLMMAFAGIIYGTATFLMYNYFAPEYYQQIFEEAVRVLNLSDVNSQQMMMNYNMYIESPILALVSAVFSMLIYGIFPALVIASIVRTKK